MAVGAQPEALLSYERVASAMDEALVAAAHRLHDALVDAAPALGVCPTLGHDLDRFARDALAHDRRAGRTGRGFCDADSSYAFDRWTRAEVEAWARTLPPSSAGLLDRLHVEGLGALVEPVAAGPPPEKRGFWEGVWEGLTVGSFEEEPFADGWGRFGKTVGQLSSGFLVYGDVRDSVAEFSRGNWVGGLWNGAGAVPYLGDAAKVFAFAVDSGRIVRAGMRAAEAADDVAAAAGVIRIADHELADAVARARRGEWNVPGGLTAHEGAERGHVLGRHVISDAALHTRMARSTKKEVVSSFTSLAEADAAVGLVLARNRTQIERWLATSDFQLELSAEFDAVGKVLRREPRDVTPGERVVVILNRDEMNASDYFVKTVKIY